jgi:hypothetical protein
MCEINHFKIFIICRDDVATDMDHLHVKRIQLVDFSYIVIEGTTRLNVRLLLFKCYELTC